MQWWQRKKNQTNLLTQWKLAWRDLPSEKESGIYLANRYFCGRVQTRNKRSESCTSIYHSQTLGFWTSMSQKDKTLLSLRFVNSNQTHVHCKNPLTLEVFFLTPHFFTLPSALSFATPVWYLYIPVRKTCLQVTLHMVNCKTLHTHHSQHTFWGCSCQSG